MNLRPDPPAEDRAARAPSALAGISAVLHGFAEGETALARRRDMRELHDRLARQIAALREQPEPGPPAALADLPARVEALEAAVLRVEAAVHVELDRHVARAIEGALDRREAEGRRRAARAALARAALALASAGFLVAILLAY